MNDTDVMINELTIEGAITTAWNVSKFIITTILPDNKLEAVDLYPILSMEVHILDSQLWLVTPNK